MKLKNKLLIYIIIIHLIFISLTIFMLKTNKFLFIIGEFIVIFSIIITIYLYKQFTRPLNIISTGTESMKNKDFNTKFVPVGQYEMDQLINVYNNMIDQLRDERIKQQEQHFFLERLINATPSGIIILNFEEIITNINPSMEKIIGFKSEQMLGKKLSQLKNNVAEELNNLLEGETKTIRFSGKGTYQCQKAHFLDRGFNHHFIVIDEFSGALFEAEKNAYEKVIRMMAHEIHNSIGAINSILNSCLIFKNQLEEKNQSRYEEVLHVAIQRNNHLNQFMKNFANVIRLPKPIKNTTDLHELIKSVYILMQDYSSEKDIKWSLELQKKPFIVNIDLNQIEQALVNIIKNSIESIENKGKIQIITKSDLNKVLVIRDNGKGISKEVQQKLFTPFFSTKKNGQGIGLTLIREIFINHGLKFSLDSDEKGFTDFRIEFPADSL